jgi:FlaA1/EpsC-like NDP-sugar epimerase
MAAFFGAYAVRLWMRGPDIGPFTNYLQPAIVQTVSTVVIFFLYKFYHRRHAAVLLDEVYQLVAAVSIATLITISFIAFNLRDTLQFQRALIVLAWGLSLVTVTVGRWAHGRVQRALQARGVGVERALIVGTGEVGRMILQKMQQTPGMGYTVVGFIDGQARAEDIMGLPVLGRVEELPLIIEQQDIQEVIIGLPEATHNELTCSRSWPADERERPGRPAAAERARRGAARLEAEPEARCGSVLGSAIGLVLLLAADVADAHPDQARFARPGVLCARTAWAWTPSRSR